jgi:hypothetical protein
LLAVAPIELPPEVLVQKAREFAAAQGYTVKPADWSGWYRIRHPMIEYLKDHRASRSWAQLFAAENPTEFYYRESPQYLVSPPDGNISENRPPLDFPGMVAIVLDTNGRVRQFEGIAPRFEENGAAPPVDPAAVFRAAGLDLAQFQEVKPVYTPSIAFDSRRAWTGAFPGLPGVNSTIEIATFRGTLTSFFIRWPWTKPPTLDTQTTSDNVFTLFSVICIFGGLLATILVARRNLRLGRGDKTGAMRIAVVQFVLFAITVLASKHVIPRFDILGFGFEDIGFGLGLCGLLWLLYIALEPAVRARWPHSLITWNRLLAGQIGDPRLGSHILIGAVLGIAIVYLFVWRAHWAIVGGGPPDESSISILQGPRETLRFLTNTLFNAILTGFAIFFLLCGFRALLRRDWLASLAAAMILTLQSGNIVHSTNVALDIGLNLFVFGGLCFLLLRMGLVPAILCIYVANTILAVPVGAEFSTWYNSIAFELASIVAAITIFGFVRSQAHVSGPPLPRTR